MCDNETPVESPATESNGRRISTKKLITYTAIILIALTAGYIHYRYVSHLFENNTNFSHMSEMEREMLLWTEMGFYYSYYKTIVQERPFMAGIAKLMYDRLVEYPNDVNAFNRFNIHPEVLIGGVYRYLEPVLNTTKYRECHVVERGGGMSPVESCVGIGQPIMFYLEAVWILAGLNVAGLFLQAVALSESVLGGVVAVIQYFANHMECTRVQWWPNERENMAGPLLILQMWLVSLQLRDKERRTTLQLQISIFVINCVCLLFWQFTQFIFLSQLAIFFVMEQFRIINIKTLCILLHSHFCGLHMSVLILQGNDMLKTSMYTSFFIVLSIYCLFFSTLRVKVIKRWDLLLESWLIFVRIALVVAVSLYLKRFLGDFLGSEQDTHIWDILYAKLTSYKNFHTLLYTCSDAFGFLPFLTVKKVMLSFLLPFVVLSVVNVVKSWWDDALLAHRRTSETDDRKNTENKEFDKDSDTSDEDSGVDTEIKHANLDVINEGVKGAVLRDDFMGFLMHLTIDPTIFYNISQMVVYGIMAGLVMRLKLLFVPQMCAVSALVMNRNYYKLPSKYIKYIPIFWIIIILPVLMNLVKNVNEELSHIGEFSDPHQEELMQWIVQQGGGAVFAGSMPLMATVMLVARRAIVTHPHYENKEARQRVYAVYKMYGRFTAEELYEELSRLRATHVVVETRYCYGRSSKGCSLLDIWDAEVGRSSRPALCHILLSSRADHLYPVYRNPHYAVFKLHDYSVRYMPRSFDT